jgi:hypothetical protein
VRVLGKFDMNDSIEKIWYTNTCADVQV